MKETTELSTDVKTIADVVKEKIRADFADLIPDEMWDGMIAKEVDGFVSREIPGLIRAALTAEAKKAIADQFAKPEWQNRWGDNGRQTASEMVETLIKKNALEIVGQVFTGVMEQQLQQFIASNRQY